MPKDNKQKIKLLYLMEILRQDTDEQHPISTNQICARLAEQGISCERRTVGMDMKVLNDYGYEIMTKMVGHEKAYYIDDRSFSVPEIKILMDAVQAAKFITPGKSEALIEKLAALGGSHQAEILKGNIVCFDTRKHTNEMIFYNVQALEDAIREHKKASFLYFDLNENKANVYITEQAPSIIKPEQTKSTSPSTDQITINPDSGYTLSSVTVEPITGTLLSSLNTDFRADNIRKDIDLFGITGTLDPSGGSFNPYPWKDIEVGTITPSSNTTTLNIDESKGTPLALVISLADMNGISQSNNAIYNASFSTSNVKANPAHIVVYQGALSVGTSTSYPTYSNGA